MKPLNDDYFFRLIQERRESFRNTPRHKLLERAKHDPLIAAWVRHWQNGDMIWSDMVTCLAIVQSEHNKELTDRYCELLRKLPPQPPQEKP